MSVSMKPIGTMKSLFHFKNGTPRQASVCKSAPGVLTIEKSVFNNPEHSLEGLEEYSHAWVIFVFHKNNNAHTKAKVKPPRLDGKRTGVFSSRSPYRPNNIGLSLVKIDKIEGSSIYFSGIDMIDGTPVLDVKPYIPEYDFPQPNLEQHDIQVSESCMSAPESDSIFSKEHLEISKDHGKDHNSSSAAQSEAYELEKGFYALSAALDKAGEKLTSKVLADDRDSQTPDLPRLNLVGKNLNASNNADEEDLDDYLSSIISHAALSLSSEPATGLEVLSSEGATSKVSHKEVLDSLDSILDSQKCNDLCISKAEKDCERKSSVTVDSESSVEGEVSSNLHSSLNNNAVVAPWLLNPPVHKLKVTFTSDAEKQLQWFSKSTIETDYKLQLLSEPTDLRAAISDVLKEEPRSVYRRHHCQDSLYFFTVDVVHVTCWFDKDVAQVLRLQPISYATHLKGKSS